MDAEIRKSIEISKVNSANASKSHVNRRRVEGLSQGNSQTQLHLQTESLPSGEIAPALQHLDSAKNAKVRPTGTGLDPNWVPNLTDYEAAYATGMTQTDVPIELTKFRAHHAQKGTQSHNWSATWVMWCQRWKERPAKGYNTGMPGIEPSGPFTPTPEQWHQAAKIFIEQSRWSRYYGPEPGMGGCRCPDNILTAYGIDPKTGGRIRTGT
jgi:hypothetical protein